jgi:hypothetical protein
MVNERGSCRCRSWKECFGKFGEAIDKERGVRGFSTLSDTGSPSPQLREPGTDASLPRYY